MDRKTLTEFTHRSSNELLVERNAYKQWVFRYTFLELEKDLGDLGDISTDLLFSDRKKVKANIVAKEPGVVAGINEIRYFLMDSDPRFRPGVAGIFDIKFEVKDGENVKVGDSLMTISADLHDILAVERVVLNLLSRMSGVATFTKKLVDMVKDFDVLLSPTRKTLWGLLDKRAVVVGGGGTHRLNLSDSIIIKDTHLDLLDRDIDRVFELIAEKSPSCRFLEIEVGNKEEAGKVVKNFGKLHDSKDLGAIPVLMFDNMKPSDIAEALREVKSGLSYNDVLFEASGGIDEANLLEYAKTGVDIISMGCLTGGVKGLDLSLGVV